jgi:hypothetical protein
MKSIDNSVEYESESAAMDSADVHQEKAVYLATDIQRALGLGRSKTYEYLRTVYKTQQPFRVIKIGKVFRIPKKSFDRWLYADSEEVG